MKEKHHEQYYGIEKGYNPALIQVFQACGTGNALAAALMNESRPRIDHDSKVIVNRYLDDLTTGFQLAIRTDHTQDAQVMRDMIRETVPVGQADRADTTLFGQEARELFDEELSDIWGENTEDESEKMPEEFAIPSKTDRHFTINFGHFIATADYLRSLPIENQPYYRNTLVDQSFIGNWKLDHTPENIWKKIVRVKYVTRELLDSRNNFTNFEFADTALFYAGTQRILEPMRLK